MEEKTTKQKPVKITAKAEKKVVENTEIIKSEVKTPLINQENTVNTAKVEQEIVQEKVAVMKDEKIEQTSIEKKEVKSVVAPVAKPVVKPVEKIERKYKDMKLPDYKEFLKSGIQFGHQTNKWNPKMSEYIFTTKNNIHVIDINKTLKNLSVAMRAMQIGASSGSVLFVGTKAQLKNIIKDEAIRCGAFFVTNRWAGGLLSNYKIIKKSLEKLNDLERKFEEGVENRTKQEISWMKKDWERLNRLYGGVKGMTTLPKIIFVVDVNFELGVIREAKTLNIPVIALCDTNSDPDLVSYAIPGNDDAIGAVKLVTGLIADAVLDGNQGGGVKHMFKDYTKMEVEVK